MFQELMPLLNNRTVLITVAKESETIIRVNAIPKRAHDNENAALTTPLSFTGTPEELDRDFPRALAEYVDSHQRLSNTLAQAKAEMEAAAKTAQDEAKRKREEGLKKKTTATAQTVTSNSPQVTTTTNAEPASTANANLFGTTTGAATPSQPGGKLCL